MEQSPQEKAFWRCHDHNPDIYLLFVRFTLDAAGSGREYFGAAAIWERIRWFTQVEERRAEFKLNNNHRAYYVRMFVNDFPEYASFFKLRKMQVQATIDPHTSDRIE
jgi:hypothetical protein